MKEGKLIILVAPSGGGKSTLAKRLFDDFDQLRLSVSATTRAPREGEQDGVHYYFISHDEFQQRIDNNEFVEWEEFYNGTRYGTLQSAIENKIKSGYFILLDIEVKGAINIKKIFGEQCLSIFIQPPSLQVLEDRLKKRGTENDETLALRLERAKEELTYSDQFDRVIINDDLDTAYAKVKMLVSDFLK